LRSEHTMRIMKIDSPYKEYQAFRLESKDLNFTAYEKDYGKRFIIEESFDSVAPFHRLIVNPRHFKDNSIDSDTKWNTILDEDLKIDSMAIRPKDGNLYKRLEVSYEGVNLYFRLLKNPENADLRREVEILRVSQGLTHSLERYTFDQEEYRIAQNTHESSQRTLTKLEETHNNFLEKMTNLKTLQKETGDVDQEKMDYYTERLYFYKIKIKRTKRRMERAEKRYLKAKDDLQRAKNRIDFLQAKLKEFGHSTKVIEEKPFIQTITPVVVASAVAKKISKKETRVVLKEPSQSEKHLETPPPPSPISSKRDYRPYCFVVIAFLMAIIGWLMITRPLPVVQNAISPQMPTCECKPTVVKEIVYVEKECPIPDEIDEAVVDAYPEETEALANQTPTEQEEDSSLSDLDLARKFYRKGVLNNQTSAPYDFNRILEDANQNYLQSTDNHAKDIEDTFTAMNSLWNRFREVSLEHYYENNNRLKEGLEENDVLYKQYVEDEIMLYQYTKRYQKMFKDIATQFLKSEAGQNCHFKAQIEKQMKKLGQPEYKLKLLKQMRQVSLQ
ncbi:MAG: hypothetical protein JXR30_03430, partial [Alphaproteobacteria bacterium]|nr:hypothetical protein [Alphaproteobacteria bacterium]